VSNAFNSLSDDEIRKIPLLVETLEKSTFDFLQLHVGDLKLTIGTGNFPSTEPTRVDAAVPSGFPETQTSAATPAPLPAASTLPMDPRRSVPEAKEKGIPSDGMKAITAPIIGRFYERPEPGAAPFVTVGSVVKEDTTVCLIEVMKLFQAVPAGVGGVITEICVQDAQMVEYGQTLFRVRPGR
jgi:acetyl-CoA carboxylase biotin carboxyl carrier protein